MGCFLNKKRKTFFFSPFPAVLQDVGKRSKRTTKISLCARKGNFLFFSYSFPLFLLWESAVSRTEFASLKCVKTTTTTSAKEKGKEWREWEKRGGRRVSWYGFINLHLANLHTSTNVFCSNGESNILLGIRFANWANPVPCFFSPSPSFSLPLPPSLLPIPGQRKKRWSWVGWGSSVPFREREGGRERGDVSTSSPAGISASGKTGKERAVGKFDKHHETKPLKSSWHLFHCGR